MGVDVQMYIQCPRLMRLDEVQVLGNALAAELGHGVLYDEFVCFANADEVEDRAGKGLLHAEGSVLDILVGGPARFYNEYELPKLFAIAEAIERRLPGAVVWYGGSDGGPYPKPWTVEDRAALAELHPDAMRRHSERLREAERKVVEAVEEEESA